MSIESVGAYSPDTIYGQLTMPFTNKPVHINAHTPDEEYGDAVYTRDKFYNNLSDMQVSIEDIADIKSLELDDRLKIDIGIKEFQEFPPKPNVNVFQSSTYLEGQGVVYKALQNGYPADRAIVIGKASSVYKNAMNFGSKPVEALLDRKFQVS